MDIGDKIQRGHPFPVDDRTILGMARRVTADTAAAISGHVARWQQHRIVRTYEMLPGFVYADDVKGKAQALKDAIGDIAQGYGARAEHSFEEIKRRVDELEKVPIGLRYAQLESDHPEAIFDLEESAFSPPKEHFPYQSLKRSKEHHPDAWKRMIEKGIAKPDDEYVAGRANARATGQKRGFGTALLEEQERQRREGKDRSGQDL